MKSCKRRKIERRLLSMVMALVLAFTALVPMTVSEVNADSKGVSRIYGTDRYSTSIKIANYLKTLKGISRFDNVVIASGKSFPDALSGSYLANVTEAPILLVDPAHISSVASYVKRNMSTQGTAYILGGNGAIPDSMDRTLKSNGVTNIVRLGGKDRIGTNLLVLKEADRIYEEKHGTLPKQAIVCSSRNYPDSLVSGATGLPVIITKGTFRQSQYEYFAERPRGSYFLAGGTGAVTEMVENDLKSYGNVVRLSGDNRYDTAVTIARKFFGKTPNEVIVATGNSFADGLCASTLAQAKKCPILLTNVDNLAQAYNYAILGNVKEALLVGGPKVVSAGNIATTKSRYSRGFKRYTASAYIYINRDGTVARKEFTNNGFTIRPTKGGLISGGDTEEIERRMESASYGTAIVIYIDKQKLDYAENGVVIFSSDIISGLPTPERETPTGTYYVNSKNTDIFMKGDDYLVYSDYWLGFISNQYGIHDASWIPSEDMFGGDTYTWRGSHGCINMPPSVMGELFNLVSVGTRVEIRES